MPDEVADLREKLQQLAKVVANTVDLDKLLAIAQTAPAVSGIDPLAARRGGSAAFRGVASHRRRTEAAYRGGA